MPVVIIEIKNGVIMNKPSVRNFFDGHEDGHWTIRSAKGRKRSSHQNSYYWAAVVPQVKGGLKDAGYEGVDNDEDVHTLLKTMFLKKNVVNPDTGQLIAEIAGSTTGLTTVEFSDFIEKVAKFCAEYLGFALSLPNSIDDF